MRAYRDRSTGADHVAWIAPDKDGKAPADGALVRVHSECLTGEAFGSLKCECGPQLQSALDTIEAEGGVVIYLRGHEGRGIGLINKLKAYRLQEDGYDTLDANIALGLPADARDYGAATGILKDLGISPGQAAQQQPREGAPARGARRHRHRPGAAGRRRGRVQRGLPRRQARPDGPRSADGTRRSTPRIQTAIEQNERTAS